MPRHKVAKAITEQRRLKDRVKADTVLMNGSVIIAAALDGDTEAVIEDFAREFKEFQISHDDEVSKGSVEGKRLAEGLLTHL